jgi:glucosamine kinase
MNTALLTPSGARTPQALAGLRFLLGVDGGGTGTRVRLADREGRLLGQGEAGPSALLASLPVAWRHIQQAALAAARQAGLEGLDPAQCAIGLGLSGVSVKANAQKFLDDQPGYPLLALDSDGWTTLLGAHGGQAGVVIAAGTGSIGEALRRDGSRAVSSGWGWIGGDEGSGAWLGLKAVAHVQEVLDGRACGARLAHTVMAVTGCDRVSILAWKSAAGQAGFASLAPLVFESAEADPVAATFVADAAAELEKLAHALDPAGELPLALSGSVARRLEPHFPAAIRARCVPSQGDSAMGGLHLVRAELQRLTTTA